MLEARESDLVFLPTCPDLEAARALSSARWGCGGIRELGLFAGPAQAFFVLSRSQRCHYCCPSLLSVTEHLDFSLQGSEALLTPFRYRTAHGRGLGGMVSGEAGCSGHRPVSASCLSELGTSPNLCVSASSSGKWEQ